MGYCRSVDHLHTAHVTGNRYIYCILPQNCQGMRPKTTFCLGIWIALPFLAFSQWEIPEPELGAGNYSISDTIYMSPTGDDSAPGTAEAPVKSFDVALDLLPFGVEGVNGGHSYGLIMFYPGHYFPDNGFRQSVSRWKQGNTYKNVSVEGIGEVRLGGTPTNFSEGHLLLLLGDHIYVKNLDMAYCDGIGLLLNRNPDDGRQHNVLIDGVRVDSAASFSMLLRNVDTITIRNSGSFHASRPGSELLAFPCSWPSGIKFFACSQARIHDSEIAFTRGEGLNFHNSFLGEAFDNRIHDNPTNIYNDNSAKLSLHHNLIYNQAEESDDFWRTCPADTNPTWAGAGLLIANEGACDRGNFPVFEQCQTRCSLPDEIYSNVDSVFVFNNVMQNVGSAFRFWQGVTDIPGGNCIRNVWVFNNTILGITGDAEGRNGSVVSFFFPSYNILLDNFYGYMENVEIHGNVFAYDPESGVDLKAVRSVFHDFHPRPGGFTFSQNVWVEDHSFVNDGIVRPNLPTEAPLFFDAENALFPCDARPEWIHSVTSILPELLTDDFLRRSRSESGTNAGALEYMENCSLNSAESLVQDRPFAIFPNPCKLGESLSIQSNSGEGPYQYQLFRIDGVHCGAGQLTIGGQIPISSDLQSGIYYFLLRGKKTVKTQKLLLIE